MVKFRIIKNLRTLPYKAPAKSPIRIKSIMNPTKKSLIPKPMIMKATKIIEINETNFNLLTDHKLALYVEIVCAEVAKKDRKYAL